jgi:hypothetical protein
MYIYLYVFSIYIYSYIYSENSLRHQKKTVFLIVIRQRRKILRPPCRCMEGLHPSIPCRGGDELRRALRARRNSISLECNAILKAAWISQPNLRLLFLNTETMKQPSASINPVTHQGSNLEFEFVGEVDFTSVEPIAELRSNNFGLFFMKCILYWLKLITRKLFSSSPPPFFFNYHIERFPPENGGRIYWNKSNLFQKLREAEPYSLYACVYICLFICICVVTLFC